MVYDSTNKNIYVATASGGTPLYKVAYSSTTGYGTPSAINVASSNGSSATALLEGDSPGGINAMVIGPDSNIWFIEHNGRDTTQYVGVAAINSSVINPTNGATISPGTGVFAEYTVAAVTGPGCCSGATPSLHSIASMGGFIWVLDKDGDLWRINPTTGLVSPNLGAGYAPGASVNPASNVTDPTGATQISTGTGGRQLENSPLFAFGSSLYVANYSYGSLDTLAVDASTTPSAGICTPSGPPPCIATFTRSLTGQFTPEYGGGTDGTNMYVNGGGPVYKITTGGVLTTSTGSFSNYVGGVGISPDGWLWTLNDNGVEGLKGMTSSALVDPTAVTVCESGADGLKRGAIPFMIGPGGTFLFTPDIQPSSGSSAAALCAVVY